MTLSRHMALKAEMLCFGVLPTGDSLETKLPLSDPTFIHGTVFELSDGSIVNTSNWDWPTDQDPIPRSLLSIPKLERQTDGSIIVANQTLRIRGRILSFDKIDLEESLRAKLHYWFSLHSSNTLFCAPVRQCIYIVRETPCTFCTFEGAKFELLQPDQFKRFVSRVKEAHPEINSIAIGGGTPNLRDMGAKYFSELVAIAKDLDLSVSIEMVPPESVDCLEPLYDRGLDSIIMSLEVWDQGERQKWCLGKGQVKLEQYKRAWESGIKHLGRGRVSSVLLVGTETLDQTRHGAKELVALGVIPTLIPLRWYPASRFTNWAPVNPLDYIDLERNVGKDLSKAGLRASRQPGCLSCGGCSLETHFEDLVGQVRD